MKKMIPRTSTAVLLLTILGSPVASAAPATLTGPTALAVAAVVAPYSPLLSAYEKKLIAGIFDGNVKVGDKRKLSVVAETVTCKVSNVAIAERSCDLTFAKGKRSLKGRAANELYATLASAGIVAEGAAGSMIQNVTKLNCTLDPVVIKDNSGSGADCSFGADQQQAGDFCSRLVAGRREQISAASDGTDDRGLGRVRFDLAPDSHDAQIDGAIEGFAVARIGQFQQALA